MNSCSKYIFTSIAILTLAYSTSTKLVFASNEAHDDDAESQDETPDVSRDAIPTKNSPSQTLTPAERDKANSELLKAVADTFKNLEELKKELDTRLDIATKANDTKTIALIKKEIKEKYQKIKKDLQAQSEELEEREFPDGKTDIPLSESGKIVSDELIKSARLQAKVEKTLKPLTQDQVDKMEKARVALAKDSMASSIGAVAGGIAGSVLGMPILGATVGASVGRATAAAATHSNTDSTVKDKTHLNSDVASVGKSNASDEIDVTSDEYQDRYLQDKNDEEELTADNASLKSAKEEIAKIAEDLLKTQDRILYAWSELANDDPDAREIWGLLQVEFMSELDKLTQIKKKNAGKSYSAELDKEINKAIEAVSEALSIVGRPAIANTPPQSFDGWDLDSNPNIVIENPNGTKPTPPTNTEPEPWSFDWIANKISDGFNYLVGGSNNPTPNNNGSQSNTNIVNNYEPDPITSEPNHESSSKPADTEPSYPSPNDTAQNTPPTTASNPATPSSGSTKPSVPSTSTNPTTPGTSLSGNGSNPSQVLGASGQPEQLTRGGNSGRGIGGSVGINNGANHIYDTDTQTSENPSDTRISNIPDTIRSGSSREIAEKNKDNPRGLSSDSNGTEENDDSQVSFSNRKKDAAGNSKNGRKISSSQDSNYYTNDITANSTTQSQSQNGLQQTQPLQGQNALPGSANLLSNNNQGNGEQDQSFGTGGNRLRQIINSDGSVTYLGPQKSSSLFTNGGDTDPETLPKISAKNPEPKKPVESAYASQGNPDFEPKKTTTGDQVARAMPEEDKLKDLLDKSEIIVGEIPDSAKLDTTTDKSLGTLAELARYLDEEVSATRTIASQEQQQKNKKLKFKKSIVPTKAMAGSEPTVNQPASFLSKILGLFGV